MALSYLTGAALMKDADFLARTKIAALHYAAYIIAESSTTPFHNTRKKWADFVVGGPENAVGAIMPVLIMDPQVQLDGAAITDTALQTALEASVNKVF